MESALKTLSEPDPNSTSRDEEGRRIVQIAPNTRQIVNYEHYRDMTDMEVQRAIWREQKKEYRGKSKNVLDSPTASRNVRPSEAATDPEAEATTVSGPNGPSSGQNPTRCPYTDLMNHWNLTVQGTTLSRKESLNRTERAKIRKKWVEKPDITYWRSVFECVIKSDFLCGGGSRGWTADMMFCFQTHTKSGTPIHERILRGIYDKTGKKDSFGGMRQFDEFMEGRDGA